MLLEKGSKLRLSDYLANRGDNCCDRKAMIACPFQFHFSTQEVAVTLVECIIYAISGGHLSLSHTWMLAESGCPCVTHALWCFEHELVSKGVPCSKLQRESWAGYQLPSRGHVKNIYSFNFKLHTDVPQCGCHRQNSYNWNYTIFSLIFSIKWSRRYT